MIEKALTKMIKVTLNKKNIDKRKSKKDKQISVGNMAWRQQAHNYEQLFKY